MLWFSNKAKFDLVTSSSTCSESSINNMSQIFIRGIQGETCLYPSTSTLEQIIESYSCKTKVPIGVLRASQYSKPITELDPFGRVDLSLRVLGGKGGFGSMLKGQGIIARVDNFESCRDLYGRRIRDVNNEIRLKDWKQKQDEKKITEEEEEEQQKQRQREEEVKVPKKRVKKVDKEFRKSVEKRRSCVAEAFEQGLRKKRNLNKD